MSEEREQTPTVPPRDVNRFWRGAVGGMWDEIGRLQFDFLLSKGLRPAHRLLDVGCGSLRGGMHFARYLDASNYFGIDRDEDLLEAGRTHELMEAGVDPASVTLSCRDDFVATDLGVTFDYALAQSVFTHLPWNTMLRCLVEVERVLASDGRFYVTFFEDPDGTHQASPIAHEPGGVTTHPDQDPYHYEFSVFQDLAQRAGLEVEYIGDWNHPRDQKMMVFRRRADGMSLPSSRPGSVATDPVLSVVVVVHEMEREAPRTLHTLTPGYQGVAPHLYEVIVVDNGSTTPLGRERVESIAENFRYLYVEPGNPSPVEALNLGARQSRGRQLGLMIDGARMLSPGVLQYALRAERAYQEPVVATLGYHLGPDPHPLAAAKGYDQAREDELLAGVAWERDGHELFGISTLAGSSKHGMFGPLGESNCVFVSAATFAAVDGFHAGFDEPGGGMANLDFFREVVEMPHTELVILLGEGTFHQFHGGAITSRLPDEGASLLQAYNQNYRSIRGRDFRPPLVVPDVFGHAPAAYRPLLSEAIDLYARFEERQPAAARILDALPHPPNGLGQPAHPPRAVLVLGMHRSGTSVLAGSLQAAGLELGDVVESALHNRKGNRENPAILLLQEDILAHNGGSWDQVPPVVKWRPLHRMVRDHIIAGFRDTPVWGFKDPRTLITLDGWLEALPDAEFVGIFRHPLLVAESLRARNKMPLEQGLELWRIYNERLLALHQAKAFPLLEFDDDHERLRQAMWSAIRLLKLPGRFREPAFFDDALRHQRIAGAQVPARYLGIFEELRERQSEV